VIVRTGKPTDRGFYDGMHLGGEVNQLDVRVHRQEYIMLVECGKMHSKRQTFYILRIVNILSPTPTAVTGYGFHAFVCVSCLSARYLNK